MTVRVRSVPPCVSSQIGTRHLPLKQGIVSSSLTWRTNNQCRKPDREGGLDCGSKPLLTRGLLTRYSLARRTTMPYKKLPIGGAHSEILSWANHDFSIEEQSMLRNVSRLPCLFKHVALMPDAHLGKGSMVGSDSLQPSLCRGVRLNDRRSESARCSYPDLAPQTIRRRSEYFT